MHPGAPSGEDTRSRLLREISVRGPVTTAELAGFLQLTGAAVRRHLVALGSEGLVRTVPENRGVRRERGRPSQRYVLGRTAHRDLGDDYDELATMAFQELRAVGGDEAIRRLAERRLDLISSRHAEVCAAIEADREARNGDVRAEEDGNGNADEDRLPVPVAALVQVLDETGYAASVRPAPSILPARGTDRGERSDAAPRSIQLCQGHCPVRNVAEQFPELCEAETREFAALVGVPVQRLATLAADGHACTTHIPIAPVDSRAGPMRRERDDPNASARKIRAKSPQTYASSVATKGQRR